MSNTFLIITIIICFIVFFLKNTLLHLYWLIFLSIVMLRYIVINVLHLNYNILIGFFLEITLQHLFPITIVIFNTFNIYVTFKLYIKEKRNLFTECSILISDYVHFNLLINRDDDDDDDMISSHN